MVDNPGESEMDEINVGEMQAGLDPILPVL